MSDERIAMNNMQVIEELHHEIIAMKERLEKLESMQETIVESDPVRMENKLKELEQDCKGFAEAYSDALKWIGILEEKFEALDNIRNEQINKLEAVLKNFFEANDLKLWLKQLEGEPSHSEYKPLVAEFVKDLVKEEQEALENASIQDQEEFLKTIENKPLSHKLTEIYYEQGKKGEAEPETTPYIESMKTLSNQLIAEFLSDMEKRDNSIDCGYRVANELCKDCTNYSVCDDCNYTIREKWEGRKND